MDIKHPNWKDEMGIHCGIGIRQAILKIAMKKS
jgi:hypothetical protein